MTNKNTSAPAPLSRAVLDELAEYPTPAVANGIERFSVRSFADGYMDASVRCSFPDLGPMVAYAATAKIQASEKGVGVPAAELWEHIQTLPEPRVLVVQDVDDQPGVGSYWGEVNCSIYRALGCIGTVTNGCVRDLEEMEAVRFHAFAGSVGVSHAYVRLVEVGTPVTIGGLTVQPGDLLHGDRHGVLSVPLEIAPRLAAAVREVETNEREVIGLCESPEFSVDALAEIFRRRAGNVH